MPPLTPAQAPIWLGQSLAPDSPLYNMAFAFVFPRELRADLFREAWNRVTRDNEALRSRVVVNADGSAEVVLDEVGADVVEEAMTEGPEDGDGTFAAWCRHRALHRFEAGAPLVQSVLVRLGGGRTAWFLNQHHLIADAWSTRLVYERVAAEYAALTGGAPVPRPDAVPYYDAVLQAPPRRQRERDDARAHWTARAGVASRSMRLYGRSARPTATRSTRTTLVLDEALSRAIDRLSEDAAFASPSADLSRLAVFAALTAAWLSRITGESAVAFDTPVAGRTTAAARRAVGLFVEMFPFAVEVAPGDSLRALGAKSLAEAERLLTSALPGSSASAGGPGQVVLNVIPWAFGPFVGTRPQVTWVHPGHGDRAHAVRVQVHDFTASGRYTVDFDVNDEALPPLLQRRTAEHFRRLVEAGVADRDKPLAGVDIRTDAERDACRALNATAGPPLPASTVVDMFVERAAREGGRIALRQQGRALTFGELLEMSGRVAASLVRRGIQPGDRVAIAGRRSTLSVVAILGVLRARAAYVPLDPAFPARRVRYVLEDSGARAVLVGEGVDAPPGADSLAIASLVAEPVPDDADLTPPRLEDLAYLLYTSGSTGRPKGVPIDHGGLADYLTWAERRYVRGERLCYPLFTALTFDLTVTSLFLPLITGGTLEIYPESDGPVDTAVMDVAHANAVDFIKLTPSHLSLLRQLGLAGSRIRRMVVGGEDLKASLAAAVSAQIPGLEIHNEYGPTEAVVGCVAHRYDPMVDLEASVPIGRPADHVTVELLNDVQAPVPEGVPGELWISRYGLARGYHRLPLLTAERFVDDPDRPGVRRYRSGDLVRLAAPDRLEYLGRVDHQVKLAGQRVELGEVEAALLAVPGVEACAAAVRRTSPAGGQGRRAPRHCDRCGLPSTYPRAQIDADGICNVCRSYDAVRERAAAYFRTLDDLRELLAQSASRRRSGYDCLMLYSGGKDSTFALCRLVDLGLSVYAFTLDNGFLSESAKRNIRAVTSQLGVPLHMASTPGMNAIFRESLARFANVCNGCFKTIYTLGMLEARELGIPVVITGLSRGQLFETRLTADLFAGHATTPDEVDAAVLAARKAYHRTHDAVAQAIDVRPFADDAFFDEVQVVDFYRYCDTSLDEMYAYLQERVPWVRPQDTGRSTNCLINDVGIYVHQRERGFHNYALPYSWDVRLGHKTRAAALAELDDEIDAQHVRRTLTLIGYDESRLAVDGSAALEAFYVSADAIPDATLAGALRETLPPAMVPVRFQRVGSLPLTVSGKVDVARLLDEAADRPAAAFVPPNGPVQEFLADTWQQLLGVARVGADDSFFDLGGSSLTGMQMMVALCREYDIHLPLATVFAHPRLSDLARRAEDAILEDVP